MAPDTIACKNPNMNPMQALALLSPYRAGIAGNSFVVLFLVRTCFLIGEYNIQLREELQESPTRLLPPGRLSSELLKSCEPATSASDSAEAEVGRTVVSRPCSLGQRSLSCCIF